MARINVSNVSFCYEGSYDPVFEDVSFAIDSTWKLGFIGRNGKGKTTFLNLLLGKYEYVGSITSSVAMNYFPYELSEEDKNGTFAEYIEWMTIPCEMWQVIRELKELQLEPEVLYRPIQTLSYGERTKVMLAMLFSREEEFLLLDEPTNHLDIEAKQLVMEYLKHKKGFIVVSHDRELLDACIDHVLVLNRCSIEVQAGNFTSWWENKSKRDAFQISENEKHKREIAKLKLAAEQSRRWADKNERTKIGFDPKKEPERNISTRAYIGSKTKKMQSRVKQYEQRMTKEIEEKEGLLQDLEQPLALKLNPIKYHSKRLLEATDYGVSYGSRSVFEHQSLELNQGDRLFLQGKNGCGKSTFIHAILKNADMGEVDDGVMIESGVLRVASGLKISYINQDTSFLKGSLEELSIKSGIDKTLFYTILRHLDFERTQLFKKVEELSEGQKKKVLLGLSLAKPAHLYIWDEPLNYIDIFSRMQIETLLLEYQPTMLIVDHDARFREKIATKVIQL